MDESTETTVALHSKHQTAIELGVITVVATAVAAFAALHFSALDNDLFERLAVSFGMALPLKDLHDGFGNASGIANLLGMGVVAFGAAYATIRIAGPPRYIAVVILLAVSLAYQSMVWSLFKDREHPLGFLCAIAFGAAGGLYLRSKITERRKSEAQYYELDLKNRELMQTRLELLKQDEVERRILAADLHDQVLNDLKQVVHRFEKYCKEPDPENEEKIKALTSQVMREIREVMDSLSPSVLEHLGLAAAIEDCLRRGSERSNFRTRFKSRVENEELDCLSMVEKGLLYRLVQESITNICKHANANQVRTTMENDGDELLIRVIDDGKGIDPNMMRGDSRGLKYMRYRADLIGATIAWKPGENGKGTVVEIRINLQDRRNAQAAAAQRAQVTAAQATESNV